MKSVYNAVRTGALNKEVCVSSVKGKYLLQYGVVYLFIYDLSNDALSSSAYMPSKCMVITESSIVRAVEEGG
jgi:hypothetical protein